jgi:hypothetical protein
MYTHRLAEHDAETCLIVLDQRLKSKGVSPLGYSSWWLTLDSAARQMLDNLEPSVRQEIRHSPVISIDFLLKYMAFGPRRDQTSDRSRGLSQFFSSSLFEFLPKDVIEVAQKVRNECGDLPERIIQRRIRDALDRERLALGDVHWAGLDGAQDAINGMF